MPISWRSVIDVAKQPTIETSTADASEPAFSNKSVTALTFVPPCFITKALLSFVLAAGVSDASLLPAPNKARVDFNTAVGVPLIVKVDSYMISSRL